MPEEPDRGMDYYLFVANWFPHFRFSNLGRGGFRLLSQINSTQRGRAVLPLHLRSLLEWKGHHDGIFSHFLIRIVNFHNVSLILVFILSLDFVLYFCFSYFMFVSSFRTCKGQHFPVFFCFFLYVAQSPVWNRDFLYRSRSLFESSWIARFRVLPDSSRVMRVCTICFPPPAAWHDTGRSGSHMLSGVNSTRFAFYIRGCI